MGGEENDGITLEKLGIKFLTLDIIHAKDIFQFHRDDPKNYNHVSCDIVHRRFESLILTISVMPHSFHR